MFIDVLPFPPIRPAGSYTLQQLERLFPMATTTTSSMHASLPSLSWPHAQLPVFGCELFRSIRAFHFSRQLFVNATRAVRVRVRALTRSLFLCLFARRNFPPSIADRSSAPTTIPHVHVAAGAFQSFSDAAAAAGSLGCAFLADSYFHN